MNYQYYALDLNKFFSCCSDATTLWNFDGRVKASVSPKVLDDGPTESLPTGQIGDYWSALDSFENWKE